MKYNSSSLSRRVIIGLQWRLCCSRSPSSLSWHISIYLTTIYSTPFSEDGLGGVTWLVYCKVSFCMSFLLLSFSVYLIVAGVFYDVLRGAPLIFISRRGLSLFSPRGATILEGLLYGLLGTLYDEL